MCVCICVCVDVCTDIPLFVSLGVAPTSPIYRTDWTPKVTQKVLAAALVGGSANGLPSRNFAVEAGQHMGWSTMDRTGPEPDRTGAGHPPTELISRARVVGWGPYLVGW